MVLSTLQIKRVSTHSLVLTETEFNGSLDGQPLELLFNHFGRWDKALELDKTWLITSQVSHVTNSYQVFCFCRLLH